MKRLLALFLLAASACQGSTWYVTQNGTTPYDGSSAHPWAASGAHSPTWGGAGILAGDTIIMGGTITSLFTVGGSGSAGSPITITSVSGAGTNLSGGIIATSISYINVIGNYFYGGSTSSPFAITMNTCDHWLIQDNNCQAMNGFVNMRYDTNNTYNVVRHNTAQGMGTQQDISGSTSVTQKIICYGAHNLVEYNTEGRGDDYFYMQGPYNIERNNYLGPMLQSDFGAGAIFGTPTIYNSQNGTGYNVGDILNVIQAPVSGQSIGSGGTVTVATLTGGAGTGVATVTLTTAGLGYLCTNGSFSGTYCTTTPVTGSGSGCQLSIKAAINDPHIDNFQTNYPDSSGAALGLIFTFGLQEANFSNQGSNTGNAHIFIGEDSYWSSGAARMYGLIHRFNVDYENGNIWMEEIDMDQVWAYNNTIVNAQNAIAPGQAYIVSISGAATSGTGGTKALGFWYGNILYDSMTKGYSVTLVNSASGTFASTEDFEDLVGPGTCYGGTHNITNDPSFHSLGSLDFTLSNGSKAINAGIGYSSGLTATSTTASSPTTTLAVTNLYCLCDGWGTLPSAENGDWIQIGTNAPVQLVAGTGNWSSGTVTISSAQTWTGGTPVNILGDNDIGGLPSTYVAPGATSCTLSDASGSITTAGTYTLSVTVNNSGMVRKVDFIDVPASTGIETFLGTVYVAPGASTTVSFPGYSYDGNSHTIEERAYNRWASQTPTVSNFLSLPSSGGPTPTPTPSPTPTPTAGPTTMPTPTPTPTTAPIRVPVVFPAGGRTHG